MKITYAHFDNKTRVQTRIYKLTFMEILRIILTKKVTVTTTVYDELVSLEMADCNQWENYWKERAESLKIKEEQKK